MGFITSLLVFVIFFAFFSNLPGRPPRMLSNVWQRFKPIIVIAITVGAGYGAYMLHLYIQVERDLRTRSASVVQTPVTSNTVSEIGYIYSMRDELFLHDDNTINLVWFIKVPASGERYSCSWERGFSGFKTGDDVLLIRPKTLTPDSDYGYVVGLHDQLEDKVSLVSLADEESLEMDLWPEH